MKAVPCGAYSISSARTSAAADSPKLTSLPAQRAASPGVAGSSALSTAVPPGAIPSRISAFAAATPASPPTPSRCTGPTFVTTPTCGAAMAASRRISPARLIPISTTATSCPASSPSSVSGRPTRLFRFPSLRSTRQRAAAIANAISLVVVLPLLPVMPTTRAGMRRRWYAARSPSARRESGTTITARPGQAASSRATSSRCSACSSTRTPQAPRRSAAPTNRCPSSTIRTGCSRGPASATNNSPRARVRLSVETPAASDPSAGPARSTPPVAARSSATPNLDAVAGSVTPDIRPPRARGALPRGRRTAGSVSPTIWVSSWPLPAMSTRSPAPLSRIAARIAARRSSIT